MKGVQRHSFLGVFMQEKGKTFFKIVHMGILLAAMGVYFIHFFVMPGKIWLNYVQMFFKVAAFTVAFIYFLSGYTKKAAAYYRTFLVLFAIGMGLQIITVVVQNVFPRYVAYLELIPLICTIQLAFSLNMGKQKTLIVAGIMMVFRLVLLVLTFVNAAVYSGTKLYSHLLVNEFCNALLALSVVFMVIAKYWDKEKRGAEQ